MSDTESSRPHGAAPPEEQDWNQQMIAEFRQNGGRLSGSFDGAPVLLLHHTGAKTGAERVNPMMYQQVGNSYAVFASAAGRDRNPAWYHNLQAHPDTEIEITDDSGTGTRLVPVRAHEADPQEREPIWDTQKQRYPGFADYETKTERTIPVILLDPRTSP
ncbi:nitroreductase family deazaflavin-dependent oxidoreductase [Streptomyces sp. NPDC102415]|uniref:nitroreductase family deazaflavin-dependent oxidoreductase n=1 Tax=Streptomyces sp. NPDC102415 TaxID=3366173 RepID=UPI00382B899D